MKAPHWLIRPNEKLEDWELKHRAGNWRLLGAAAVLAAMVFGTEAGANTAVIAYDEFQHETPAQIRTTDQYIVDDLLDLAEAGADIMLVVSSFRWARKLDILREPGQTPGQQG